MRKDLAKLTKVDLKEVWEHEAYDFTKWLSDPENLGLLSEEIGIEIKLIQSEAPVGKFNVDILAEEETTGRKIVIENQLLITDHDHLGKIITYASGYDAKAIIWIVKDFREEHQRAIDWLNEHTDQGIGFFLIKIELWQIEGSNPAPKFVIVVSPNEWAKTMKSQSGDLTDTKMKQLDFWGEFKSFVVAKDATLKLRKPLPQNWYDVGAGIADAHISLTINSYENSIRCQVVIPKNKQLFEFLNTKKSEIQTKIGDAEWRDSPVESGIGIKKSVSDLFDPKQKENYFSWLYDKTVLFKNVFQPYFKEFKKK